MSVILSFVKLAAEFSFRVQSVSQTSKISNYSQPPRVLLFQKAEKVSTLLNMNNTRDHLSTPLASQGIQDSHSAQMLKYDQNSLRVQSVDSTRQALKKSADREFIIINFQTPIKSNRKRYEKTDDIFAR